MKKIILSIILAVIMMVGLFPMMAHAYTPVITLTLDGQPASLSDLNGFSAFTSSILSDMSYVYIDDYPFYLTESPIGTGRFPSAQNITGDRGFGLKDSSFWMVSFNGLFSTSQFTLSESNPTPQINMFSVTYNPGSSGMGSGQKRLAAHGVNFTLRDAMYTRSGYVQTGWATSDGGNKVYNLGAGTYITAKTDLYPTWNAVLYPVTITVKKDGAVWGAGAPTITFGATSTSTETNGTSVANGTYNIYADGTDTGVDVTVSGSAASVDLNYYTVIFRNEDNTSTLDSQIVLSGKTAAYNGATQLIKPSNDQYSYTFSNWVTSAGGTTAATLTNITAAKTIYASFTATTRSYTITWKMDSSNTIDTTTVAYGITPTHSNPTKSGYNFSAWTPTIVSVTGEATYVASWTVVPYSLSYTLNGGAVAPANPADYTIESSAMTLNNPTRDGFSFVGWTGSNGTTAQTSVTIASGSTGNKLYTANWKANTPSAPEASIVTGRTDTSLTITTEAGYEYSVNNGANWHSGTGSYTFTGLDAGTAYDLVCRIAAVTSGNISAASDASASLTVSTKSVGSVTVPTPADVTYDPNVTLAEITLPGGWAWSAAEMIPTVATDSYSAVYTPTDTDTTEYSSVAGYAADVSGHVTITRTIALTVNCAAPTAADFAYAPPTSLAYSGTVKSAIVQTNDTAPGMGTVTIRYYLGAAETTPMNAGTYTVAIDIAQGDNYAAATAVTDSAWTFTIAKAAQAPLSITNKPDSITYGDSFTLATTGGSGTGAVTWAVSDGTSAAVDENTGAVTITGVDETTLTATRATDGNHTDAVMNTYTFTPTRLQLTVALPTATDGWTKTYDGNAVFDLSAITVGGITNKVGADSVTVSAQSATYETSTMAVGNKALTITYGIDGTDSAYYAQPDNTVINTASITAATPTLALVSKTAVFTGRVIEIAAATVTGIAAEHDITANYADAVTYTYYTQDTCTEADRTTVEKSGAEAVGDAPKNRGTYYVKAAINANGNYAAAASPVVTLTIYSSSSGEDQSASPVIVDGKALEMGITEVKDGTTTVKVDQKMMIEQLNNAKDSVVIPITAKTDTASAQLVVQNVERMAERGVSLTIAAGSVSYSIPSGAIDTAAVLKALGAADSSQVPLNITISNLSDGSVTIQQGTLMVPPVAFTVTATYNGQSVAVEKFGSFVQRVIQIPDGTDPESITTAVVVEADGSQRHVPTEVYTENGKWYARINAMTNSTYALIQNSVSFTDAKNKWYDASVTEMASREIIGGIGKNMFAGERAITRAEFAAILIRALGLPADSMAAKTFNDVQGNQWYFGAVGTAYEYGLVTGKGQGHFDPTGNITRQEAMTMIARAAKLAGYEGKVDSISEFSDADGIGAWASDAVKFNVGSGLIVGSNGQLRPQDEISRAETATVVLRLLRNSALIDRRD